MPGRPGSSPDRHQVLEDGEAAVADAVDLAELLDRPEQVRDLPKGADGGGALKLEHLNGLQKRYKHSGIAR